MVTTPRLVVPLMEAAQAQKHLTHNEAIRIFDIVCQLSVKSRVITAPPGSPAQGDCYIIPSGATGAWAGLTGKVAGYSDTSWLILTPKLGWLCYVEAENLFVKYVSGVWATTSI